MHGGVHFLAIFDSNKGTSDIDKLLGAVEYDGESGKSDGVTKKSAAAVVDKVNEHGGVAIPAHVDKKKGLFASGNTFSGNTLRQVLNNKNILAMELCDSDFKKPQLYYDMKPHWSEVVGSDAHKLDSVGLFTWIKMGEKPSIEGLKLALLDGSGSVKRDVAEDPNDHAELVIEELRISGAKYMGRSKDMVCKLSPFLNTIIGGRGSGKSTLLEFMRLVLRRDKDITGLLRQELAKYLDPEESEFLLTQEGKIEMIYRKGKVRYRLNWSRAANSPSLEIADEKGWQPIPGEIRSLLPVDIYSQKQIFELASRPDELIRIIDTASEVGAEEAGKNQKELERRYRQIGQDIQELCEKCKQKDKISGEMEDCRRQLQEIEKSGHKEALKSYRICRQQLAAIEVLESAWQDTAKRLADVKDSFSLPRLDEQYFADTPEVLSVLTEENKRWLQLSQQLGKSAAEAQSILNNWREMKDRASWMQQLRSRMDDYEQLRNTLAGEGVDPGKYPILLQKQRVLQSEMKNIDDYQRQIKELEAEKNKIQDEVKKLRKDLSDRRQKFLLSVLRDNNLVRIKVEPYGEAWDSVEKSIRGILRCNGKFDQDIEQLRDIYQGQGKKNVCAFKDRIISLQSGYSEEAKDGRFIKHLQGLPTESILNFEMWLPQDRLKITLGEERDIKDASPGQKTAALLSFILSYGEAPLLLDQPEDDLDNELIYSLVVKQLRERKRKRQLIVVTHNANIVINGDAEMVFVLKAGGESRLEESSSLHEVSVRRKICDVLEGGKQAFEQRYRRVHLEEQ